MMPTIGDCRDFWHAEHHDRICQGHADSQHVLQLRREVETSRNIAKPLDLDVAHDHVEMCSSCCTRGRRVQVILTGRDCWRLQCKLGMSIGLSMQSHSSSLRSGVLPVAELGVEGRKQSNWFVCMVRGWSTRQTEAQNMF